MAQPAMAQQQSEELAAASLLLLRPPPPPVLFNAMPPIVDGAHQNNLKLARRVRGWAQGKTGVGLLVMQLADMVKKAKVPYEVVLTFDHFAQHTGLPSTATRNPPFLSWGWRGLVPMVVHGKILFQTKEGKSTFSSFCPLERACVPSSDDETKCTRCLKGHQCFRFTAQAWHLLDVEVNKLSQEELAAQRIKLIQLFHKKKTTTSILHKRKACEVVVELPA